MTHPSRMHVEQKTIQLRLKDDDLKDFLLVQYDTGIKTASGVVRYIIRKWAMMVRAQQPEQEANVTTCEHGYPEGNCPQCLTIRYGVEATIHRLTTQQLEQAKLAIEQRIAKREEKQANV